MEEEVEWAWWLVTVMGVKVAGCWEREIKEWGEEGRRDERVRRGRERGSDGESEEERRWWTSFSQIYVRLSLRTNINLDTKQIKAWTLPLPFLFPSLPLPNLSTLFIIRLSLVEACQGWGQLDNLHVGPNFLPGQSLYHTNCIPNTTRVKDFFSG